MKADDLPLVTWLLGLLAAGLAFPFVRWAARWAREKVQAVDQAASRSWVEERFVTRAEFQTFQEKQAAERQAERAADAAAEARTARALEELSRRLDEGLSKVHERADDIYKLLAADRKGGA